MIQTTDPHSYFKMFVATSRPNRYFAQKHGFNYTAHVGIKSGCASWHATYNRIPMLMDLLRDGYRDWVLYMDVDAYIADLHFDIGSFLSEKKKPALLGAPGGAQPWNVNAGILFFNFANPIAHRIVAAWADGFERDVGGERLRLAVEPWQAGLKDDQVLLHEVLAHEVANEAIDLLPLPFVGWPNSTFIRQLLRQFGSLEERCGRAERDVAEIMRAGPNIEANGNI